MKYIKESVENITKIRKKNTKIKKMRLGKENKIENM